ncbi:hypothetical protein FQN49_007472 [Arthroderma sp. PD_2]|nr:hypothetical protein FQN49_007472 [Arthroderma sp. PD_2]
MSFLYPFAPSDSHRHSSGSHHGHSSSHRSHSKDRRHHRSSSSVIGGSTYGGSNHGHSSHSHHNGSTRHNDDRSIFGLGSNANRSMASSIFSASSSSRRAKPRAGFVHRMIRKIKRLFRDIMHYMKRHPMKVFFLVIMPLITGGVLQKLLSTVGIRIPGLSALSKGGGGGGGGNRDPLSGEGIAGGVSGLMSLAKAFA